MQQGTDLLAQLAQIREMQGKEPLPSPNFIAGFGPGTPPPPPPIIVPGDVLDPDEDVPDSPLIPQTQYYVKKQGFDKLPNEGRTIPEDVYRAELAGVQQQIKELKLIVMDSAAQYAGHGVMLQDSERDRIAEIVVRAVKRELDGEVATLGLREAQSQGLVPSVSGTGKRKRGRPRKNPQTPVAAS